ncbi:MAG: endonuclease domain-containing protein, partial [Actinobacteria bacterium]|nr:endonuclease domain-containing protein [Actinomycetota bacterium]
DDAYPEAKLAIEWDSRAWHLQRAAMEADRRRDRIAAMHGWLVIRVTWQDIKERPDEVIAAVGQLLHTRTSNLNPGL